MPTWALGQTGVSQSQVLICGGCGSDRRVAGFAIALFLLLDSPPSMHFDGIMEE